MVAMDFFSALNCYDFLKQYSSNLLKNPTVRGLIHDIIIIGKLFLKIYYNIRLWQKLTFSFAL